MKSEQFNLLEEEWIPVECRDGTRRCIAPWQISEGAADNAGHTPVRIASVRPDFDGALIQFLIGLMQTVCPPPSDFDWIQWLQTPLSPEELRDKMLPFHFAFNLFGDPPLFMQDFETLEDVKGAKNVEIEKVLIEVPAGTALYGCSDSVRAICPACSAAAVFCLQTECPDGGQGHRSGLRGGGPLTTIVEGASLWQTVVMNTVSGMGTCSSENARTVFPWLSKTKTSENKQAVTPADDGVSRLLVYWAMPASACLLPERAHGDRCELCDSASDVVVKQWLKKNHGNNYPSSLWHNHPLSPYSSSKPGAKSIVATNWERKPISVPPGGLAYRDYVGLAVGIPGRTNGFFPARAVRDFQKKRRSIRSEPGRREFTLRAFGYRMDNMKAVGRYDATVPLYHFETRTQQGLFDEAVRQGVAFADHCRVTLEREIKPCLKSPKSKRSISKDALAGLIDRFWAEGEDDFWMFLQECAREIGDGQAGRPPIDAKAWWLRKTQKRTLDVFDEAMQTSMLERINIRRVAKQRNKLRQAVCGEKGRNLLTLPEKQKEVQS